MKGSYVFHLSVIKHLLITANTGHTGRHVIVYYNLICRVRGSSYRTDLIGLTWPNTSSELHTVQLVFPFSYIPDQTKSYFFFLNLYNVYTNNLHEKLSNLVYTLYHLSCTDLEVQSVLYTPELQ